MARKKLALKKTAATKRPVVAKLRQVRRITLADVAATLRELERALANVREVLDEFARANPGVAMDCLPPVRRIVPTKPGTPTVPFCRNCR